MVQNEKGISSRPSAERSAMPVTMPGSAMGSTSRNDTASRPKKRLRDTAAAASVPSTSATAVAILATRSERNSACQKSLRPAATANHRSVSAGGGKL
jgi:hypothetical protein